ncbi:hypothetical protein BDZ88DRAFT_112356 [Geranomyces variabilis]|nr:hypothetical protein BDZ88DRAFT_112356 [Geranomyces variabilis]KAJ3137442.1 hypothetical protein HDU90_001843 [Geranomyces variabilis]
MLSTTTTPTTPTSFILPPYAYPHTKPYAAFTTLLHRFDRYERQRMKLATDAVALYSHEEQQPQQLGRNYTTIEPHPRACKQASKSSTSSKLTLDTLGIRLMNAAAAELTDQRVSLSKTQQVKMDLASIKAGVDSLLAEFPSPQNPAYPTPLPPPARGGQRQRQQPRDRQQQQQPQPVTILDPQRGNPNYITPSERQKFIFVGRLLQQLD